MVVGLSNVAPVALTKKQQYAQKQTQLVSKAGVDPTLTVVEKVISVDELNNRPDKSQYDLEMNSLKLVIDQLTIKQNAVKARIESGKGGGPDNARKVAIRAELDSLRAAQATLKGGRGKTLDQVKIMQQSLSKKIEDMKAAKAKLPFRSVAEVDSQIKALERGVEGGMMKLVEEKKALQEISNLRKTRKAVEGFAVIQAGIDADKAKIDDIRAGLDNPEAKALADKFEKAKSELDGINKVNDEASKGRDVLYDERNAIGKELDAAYGKKKAAMTAFRELNDKFYKKQQDDRDKRFERQRAERGAVEDEKRAEINLDLLEQAQAPAFERDIEDCRTLIRFFQLRAGGTVSGTSTPLGLSTSASGVPRLEARVVDTSIPAGQVALKKKGEDEEFFMGGGSKKGKKGPKKEVVGEKKDVALNLPFGTLSALLLLGIESPTLMSQITPTVEALEVKMKYFLENSARVTREKIQAVEKKIAQAEAKSAGKDSKAEEPAVVE